MRVNKRRREAESAIAELLIGEFKVDCDICGKSDSITCFDPDEASVAFYDSGWRADGEGLLCKKCRGKK